MALQSPRQIRRLKRQIRRWLHIHERSRPHFARHNPHLHDTCQVPAHDGADQRLPHHHHRRYASTHFHYDPGSHHERRDQTRLRRRRRSGIATCPDPPTRQRSPPPTYSILDRHTRSSSDRLIVAHPTPASHHRATNIDPVRRTPASPRPPRNLSDPLHPAPDPNSRRRSTLNPQTKPRELRTCTRCPRHLKPHEFPPHPPTKRCRHAAKICRYCMHERARNAFLARGKRGEVRGRCGTCGVGMGEGEVRRGVLVWGGAMREEGEKSEGRAREERRI